MVTVLKLQLCRCRHFQHWLWVLFLSELLSGDGGMLMNFKSMAILLVLFSVTSCVRVETGNVMPTMGEQVIDLVKAKEIGAITEEEFKKARLRLLAAF